MSLDPCREDAFLVKTKNLEFQLMGKTMCLTNYLYRFYLVLAFFGGLTIFTACGGGGLNSTIGRSAVTVAQEGGIGGKRNYTLGPQFEGRLHEMINQEVEALGGMEGVPLELNRQVLLNINRFLNEDRGFIRRGLNRGSKYIPLMKAIFRQKGLPEDLVYLALIESGFNNTATSPASAVGPWQFISSTGSRYGLEINEWVDERRDPVKSTYAAADYLTALHDTFGSWPMAIAAYNSGEGKIIQGIQNYGVSNFWDMSSVGGHLADETKLYVPSFLAATFIAKDPSAYGLNIEMQPPDKWDEVSLPQAITLEKAAQYAGITVERLQELNPQLKKKSTPPQRPGFILRLPAGSQENFIKGYNRAGQGLALVAAIAPPVPWPGASITSQVQWNPEIASNLSTNRALIQPDVQTSVRSTVPALARSTASPSALILAGPDASVPSKIHSVTSGETLGGIAIKYGLTIKELLAVNNLKDVNIYIGQKLKVPGGSASTSGGAVGRTVAKSAAPIAVKIHSVTSGETLGGIAMKYGLTVGELMLLNDLKDSSLRVSQKLKVSHASASVTFPSAGSVASAPASAKLVSSSLARSAALVPMKIHSVVSGETLGGIAMKYGLTVSKLMALNDLKGLSLRVGQKLKVSNISTPAISPSVTSAALVPAPAKPVSSVVVESTAQALPKTHLVASGEVLGGIAMKYGLTVGELITLNGLKGSSLRVGQKLKVSGASVPVTPPRARLVARASAPAKLESSVVVKPTALALPKIHPVASGETLGDIAMKYDLTVQELMVLNHLKDTNIRQGQKLTVTGGGVYQVTDGDTLYSIARRNKISMEQLKQLNGLTSNSLRLGQTLKVK
ncbi:MAG: hypothetical protein AMR96_04795 [Candidatus Adiutrix intracellularis]|nr:MAG: hypothetical protein AMR96_04795 [Candidatus Adiutrix intracellularis]